MKFISFRKPTYKDKEGLKRAIVSVLAQKYENIELFVVDDNILGADERKFTEFLMHEFNFHNRTYVPSGS